MIKTITTAVSVNSNPGALLATAEALERDGKLLMSAKALENLLLLAVQAAAETATDHHAQREDITTRLQQLQMATTSSGGVAHSLLLDSERAASPTLKRHSSQASLAASSPRTLTGQQHPHTAGPETPMSPITAVGGGSSGTLRHASMSTPPPNFSIGSNALQQHHTLLQQQQAMEHALDQMSSVETERTRDVFVAAERFLSKCNAFALVFLRDEEDTYSCTEVLCRALLYVLDDGAMLEGHTTPFVSVLPAESAAKQLIGFSGLRASAHVGAPTLPRGVQTELKKRLASPTTTGSSVTAKSALSLPSKAIPWTASPQAHRRWLSACLNNYGCMHRKQLLHADAAQLFRCAAAVDRACAPLALLNLSAAFCVLEKRGEASEVARYVIRMLTTAGAASAAGSPHTASGSARGALSMHAPLPPASSHGTASQHQAAAALLLPPDVLALGYHALAVTLETTDGLAASDAYKHALHVLSEAAPEASQVLDIIESNARLYENVLQQLHTTLRAQQQQQQGSGDGGAAVLEGGTKTASGGSSAPMQPTAPRGDGSSSSGDGRRRSFRQLQQQRMTRVASSVQPSSTTVTANPAAQPPSQAQQQQQQVGASSTGGAINVGTNPTQHNIVPYVPRALYKEFRETPCSMHYVTLGGGSEEDYGGGEDGGSTERRTPPPPRAVVLAATAGTEGCSGDSGSVWGEAVTTSKDGLSLVGDVAGDVATVGEGARVVVGSNVAVAVSSGGRSIANVLQNYFLLVDGETVVQRLDHSELRAVVAGQAGGGALTGQQSSGNIAPRPPADAKQTAASGSRKKSMAGGSGGTGGAATGGDKSPTGNALLFRGAGGGAPPKAVPQISAESILEESKRKDDVVSFLASRLTQLLRVEEYHSMRHLAAARIQFFIRPLIARRVMRFRRDQEARKQHLVELRKQAAARCITRFFRRVVGIRQNIRAQRERLRLQAIKRKHAIVVFQKYTRRWNAVQLAHRLRKQKQYQVVCAMQLQRWVRCCFAKGVLGAMVAVQSASWTTTAMAELRARSATHIQAAYRGHRTLIAFLEARGETERALRLDRQKYLTRAAKTIQRHTRGFLVRRRNASVLRPRLAMARNRFRAQLCNQSAITIQRCFRGHVVRHHSPWGPLVDDARQRALERLVVAQGRVRTRAIVVVQAAVRSFLTRCRIRSRRGQQPCLGTNNGATAAKRSTTTEGGARHIGDDDEENYFIGMRKGYGCCPATALAAAEVVVY